MIRKQVYIEPEQEKTLKRLSKQLGLSEAELVRRGIESLDEPAIIRPPDPEAARKLVALLKKRAELLPNGGGTSKWRREDVYYERLSRLSLR